MTGSEACRAKVPTGDAPGAAISDHLADPSMQGWNALVQPTAFFPIRPSLNHCHFKVPRLAASHAMLRSPAQAGHARARRRHIVGVPRVRLT